MVMTVFRGRRWSRLAHLSHSYGFLDVTTRYSVSLRTVCLAVLLAGLGLAQVQVKTANGDNNRTNSYLSENLLTPANVSSVSFGKQGVLPVDGQVFAQPLYVRVGARNVIIAVTMHNSVYAYDADSMTPPVLLWHVNLGISVPAYLLFPSYSDIGTEAGILGTGVVDSQRGVLYIVSETLAQGAPRFFLHALDLTTGAETLNGPVAIEASATFNSGLNSIAFDSQKHLQRPGLLLANGAVFIGFGSVADQPPWHGWVISYDASDLTKRVGAFASTTSGEGGGIWQSGRGLAADDAGNIYTITGNGDYDGIQNFGESFIKLPSVGLSGGDWFTPGDYESMEANDGDLSAGPVLIAGTHLLVGGDKYGRLYLVNGDSMGHLNSSNSGTKILLASPGGLIFNIAVWSQPERSYVYSQGSGEPIKCFEISAADIKPSPVSTGTIPASGRIGMALSANGTQGGILWETTSNSATGAGTLHAFDASNLAVELWNSDMDPDQDRLGVFVRFANPTVANGKVYVPTGSNITVYGMFPMGEPPTPQIAAVTNAASYAQNAISPGEVVTIFGTHLGPPASAGMQLDDRGIVATMVAGTRVLFDGIPGPIVYAGANQVSAIVPYEITSATPQVRVEYQGVLSDSITIASALSTPGIFSVDGSGSGQAVAVNADGTLNSSDNPAAPGSVISLYATGGGATSPTGTDGAVVSADNLPVPILGATARIGDRDAGVLYAGGGPGIVQGILQVNIRIPDQAPAGLSVPLVLKIGDGASQSGITIAIQAAGAGSKAKPGVKAKSRSALGPITVTRLNR
jgi:uncharacterized protein (TIGR03437 family)